MKNKSYFIDNLDPLPELDDLCHQYSCIWYNRFDYTNTDLWQKIRLVGPDNLARKFKNQIRILSFFFDKIIIPYGSLINIIDNYHRIAILKFLHSDSTRTLIRSGKIVIALWGDYSLLGAVEANVENTRRHGWPVMHDAIDRALQNATFCLRMSQRADNFFLDSITKYYPILVNDISLLQFFNKNSIKQLDKNGYFTEKELIRGAKSIDRDSVPEIVRICDVAFLNSAITEHPNCYCYQDRSSYNLTRLYQKTIHDKTKFLVRENSPDILFKRLSIVLNETCAEKVIFGSDRFILRNDDQKQAFARTFIGNNFYHNYPVSNKISNSQIDMLGETQSLIDLFITGGLISAGRSVYRLGKQAIELMIKQNDASKDFCKEILNFCRY